MGGEQKWAGWEGNGQGEINVEDRGEGDSRFISESANPLHSTDIEARLVHPQWKSVAKAGAEYHIQALWVITQNTLNI